MPAALSERAEPQIMKNGPVLSVDNQTTAGKTALLRPGAETAELVLAKLAS
jgi:hypothetical protein